MNSAPEMTSPGTGRRPIKPALGWGLVALTLFAVLCISMFSLGPTMPSATAVLLAFVGALALTAAAAALVRFVHWARSWQNLSRLLFALVCSATVIALAYAVENWRGRTTWQRHRLTLEKAGEPFALERLIPPKVPDSQNFAMTPLLAPLLDFTNTPTGVVWRDTNAMNYLNGLASDLPPNRDTNNRLVLGNLEKGTYADLAACAEFYRGNTNYPQATPDASPAERILIALGKFKAELQELRKAAADRPYAQFPVRYDTEPSWNILLPHLAKVKSLALLVNVHALAELEARRAPEAYADLNLGLRLSDSLRDEPILISHLVRIATLSFSLQTFREGLARHAWTETQLEQLQQRFAGIDLLAEYKHVIRGERAFGVAELDYLRRRGSRSLPFSDDVAVARWLFVFPSGWMYQNMLTMSQWYQQYALAAVDVQAGRVRPGLAEQATREIEAMRQSPFNLFATMLLPSIGKAAVKPAEMQTFLDAARIACAIERFRIAEAKLPANLEALVPRYLARVPNDVIDGQPLRFKVNPDGGYSLYSVGWNRVDDAGNVALKKGSTDSSKRDWLWQETRSGLVDSTQGDWVWRIL